MREIHSIEIRDEAHVGAARRAVHEYARRLGFGEAELAEVDIVVQEIGTNAARYATDGGRLHYAMPHGARRGLELFYWDTGPGIYDMDRAISDGVSTSGSLGAGIGAIRRLMDEFDVYSTVRQTGRLRLTDTRYTSHGTALLARKWMNGERAADAMKEFKLDESEFKESELNVSQRIGVWSRPHPGEEVNGDAYLIETRDARTLLAVIDGLGHGHGAKEAADVALAALDEWMGEPLDEVIEAAHQALRATRGAVMGVALIDRDNEEFAFAGVGNIEVRVFNTPERIAPISSNGTLGARLGKVRVWQGRWAEGATVIMASDGLSASWDIKSYPGLLARSPQLLAGILMRDYSRDADDATVLVAR